MNIVEALLVSPKFAEARKTHDWRNHIPECLMEAWGKLSLESRFVAYCMAEEQANSEEWER